MSDYQPQLSRSTQGRLGLWNIASITKKQRDKLLDSIASKDRAMEALGNHPPGSRGFEEAKSNWAAESERCTAVWQGLNDRYRPKDITETKQSAKTAFKKFLRPPEFLDFEEIWSFLASGGEDDGQNDATKTEQEDDDDDDTKTVRGNAQPKQSRSGTSTSTLNPGQ